MQYVEFQRIERELEHCKRIYLAWKYVAALNSSQKIEEDVKNVQSKIDSKLESIAAGENEIKDIEEKYAELCRKKEMVFDISFLNRHLCFSIKLYRYVHKYIAILE